jgi:hypothetical protein
LSGAGCASYLWGGGQITSDITVQPILATTYNLACKNLYCISAPVLHAIQVSDCYYGNLQLSGISDGNSFKSQLGLKSTQQITNTQNLNYSSPKNVILQPGFGTTIGAVFKAEIGGCN